MSLTLEGSHNIVARQFRSVSFCIWAGAMSNGCRGASPATSSSCQACWSKESEASVGALSAANCPAENGGLSHKVRDGRPYRNRRNVRNEKISASQHADYRPCRVSLCGQRNSAQLTNALCCKRHGWRLSKIIGNKAGYASEKEAAGAQELPSTTGSVVARAGRQLQFDHKR